MLPTVNTSEVTTSASTTATVGGTVTSDGGAYINERGIFWSATQNPESHGSKVEIGNGTGSFSISISDLIPNTTYFVKAYAINSKGTSFGNQVDFTTAQILKTPTVTTKEITAITTNSATVGGNVESDGNSIVTERGVFWGTTPTPQTDGEKLQIGSGTGAFSSTLTNLSSDKTYYTVAYATNSIGSGYGSPQSFTTLSGGSSNSLLTNLISYWKLDETTGQTANDSYGSIGCTVQTGVTIGQNGIVGKAVSFVGTSGGLTTGKVASQLGIHGNSSKSVSIWIKPNSLINGLNSCGIINLGSTSNQQQFGIKYYGSPAFWMFDSWYGVVRIAPNDNKLIDGSWHHIVVTYSSVDHTVKTYLDKNLVTTDATKILSTGDGMGFSIGIGSQGKYIGLIDEVGLWSRALTDSEVVILYNNGIGLQYPFD